MNKRINLYAFVVLCLLSVTINYDYAYALTDIVYDAGITGSMGCITSGNILQQKMCGEEVKTTSILVANIATINSVTMYISCTDDSSPDCSVLSTLGLVRVGIWNSTIEPTNTNYIRSFGLINPLDLRKDPVCCVDADKFTFIFAGNPYTFNQGNVILGIFYEGDTGTSGDGILIGVSTGSTFNGTNTILSKWDNNGSWQDSNTIDLLGSWSGTISDCDIPANENLLRCRLDGTATLDNAGAFVVGSTTSGTGILGIGCGIGLVDCTADSNPQTNGLGILLFIASIFIVVGMFITTQGMQNTIHLPVYLWAIMIISLSAFFTLVELIDPVFLIISIIGLIALGAPKLVGMFKGNSFGSGSTE